MAHTNAPIYGRLFTFILDPAGFWNTARIRWMLQELTFVDSVLLVTVFDLPAVRGKFSCKNIPKFTARPDALGRTNRNEPRRPAGRARAGAAELRPRGKFRCIFTAKFTTYCR